MKDLGLSSQSHLLDKTTNETRQRDSNRRKGSQNSPQTAEKNVKTLTYNLNTSPKSATINIHQRKQTTLALKKQEPYTAPSKKKSKKTHPKESPPQKRHNSYKYWISSGLKGRPGLLSNHKNQENTKQTPQPTELKLKSWKAREGEPILELMSQAQQRPG